LDIVQSISLRKLFAWFGSQADYGPGDAAMCFLINDFYLTKFLFEISHMRAKGVYTTFCR